MTMPIGATPSTAPFTPPAPAPAPAVDAPATLASTAPALDPQTPFWRSTIFWSKTIVQIASGVVAAHVVPVTTPEIQLAVGGLTLAVTELGYQAHSSRVRAAELTALQVLAQVQAQLAPSPPIQP